MRTFAQKTEPSPQARTVTLPIRDSHGAGSILGLQSTIGNRALQRMLQMRAEEPAPQPADPVQEALREANSKPVEPREPEPTRPGDPGQQARTIPKVHPDDELWPLPRIQDGLRAVAEETEARERASLKPGQTAHRTVANQMEYWEQRFIDSVDYILYRRDGGKQNQLRYELRVKEEQLMKSAPRPPRNSQEAFGAMGWGMQLIAQVEALRRTYSDKWKRTVDETADRFILLASHQARFLTVNQAAERVSVYGLPEYVEGTVPQSAHPKILAKDSTPVAPSVITFMEAVRDKSGLKAMAGNYANHEKHSPYVGNIDEVGKYSFDVDLGGLIKVNADGFYEREPLIDFFLAVDRASAETGIAWIALYNDFDVAKTVNEKLGKRRIGFSGMGSTKDDPGSIHHGPAPYLLHIHFNIMPRSQAAQYTVSRGGSLPYIDVDLSHKH